MKEEELRREQEEERIRVEKQKTERISAMLEQETFVLNYVMLKKFSLLYFHYAFLDIEDHMADQLFIENKVRVRCGREFANGKYRVIFCKVRKKDEKAFLEALDKLRRKAILMGCVDYDEMCSSLWKGVY